MLHSLHTFCFFFNDPATTEIYTLSLHDALPISARQERVVVPTEHRRDVAQASARQTPAQHLEHRRLRSEEHTSEPSHPSISYAVFCLKKKKKEHVILAKATRPINITSTSAIDPC